MSFKIGPGLPNKGKLLKKPRRTKMSVWKDKELTSVGPGTVHKKVFEINASTRERALLINRNEDQRLERTMRRLDKEHRFSSNLQNKIIHRMSNTLQQKKMMSQLLEEDYKLKNFITLRQGFDSSKINTKENARRYVIESRVLNSGFNIKAMRPEIHRKIRMLDPYHDYKEVKQLLLEDIKDQNKKINQSISDKASDQSLSCRNYLRNTNYPQQHDVLSDETLGLPRIPLYKNEVETANDRDDAEPGQDRIEAELRQYMDENTSIKDSAIDNDFKEKSIVLERRLPRREPNAFSRRRPTLGPVYFQASVNTEKVV